ncbi:MAG: hypothetical protein Q4D61_09235 [Cardiobacteriaceae bacterium]|nr:hypothetical protein [Cardiobacteriaceae bacterium]
MADSVSAMRMGAIVALFYGYFGVFYGVFLPHEALHGGKKSLFCDVFCEVINDVEETVLLVFFDA